MKSNSVVNQALRIAVWLNTWKYIIGRVVKKHIAVTVMNHSQLSMWHNFSMEISLNQHVTIHTGENSQQCNSFAHTG